LFLPIPGYTNFLGLLKVEKETAIPTNTKHQPRGTSTGSRGSSLKAIPTSLGTTSIPSMRVQKGLLQLKIPPKLLIEPVADDRPQSTIMGFKLSDKQKLSAAIAISCVFFMCELAGR
jgi:hypothetical protein